MLSMGYILINIKNAYFYLLFKLLYLLDSKTRFSSPFNTGKNHFKIMYKCGGSTGRCCGSGLGPQAQLLPPPLPMPPLYSTISPQQPLFPILPPNTASAPLPAHLPSAPYPCAALAGSVRAAVWGTEDSPSPAM